MPQYRDVSVSVLLRSTTGHRILEEYEVTIDEAKRTVTCWISSEEHKEFVISAVNQSHTHAVRCCTSIDGRQVDHALWRPLESGNIEGAYVSEDTLVPFVFSKMRLTDEDHLLGLHGPLDLEALGTIRFVVLRCMIEAEGLSYVQPDADFDLRDIGPIHERTKKVGGHCVALGDATQTNLAVGALTNDVDTEESPYCIFVFRYRPRDLLQAQGVILHQQEATSSSRTNDVKPQMNGASGPSSSIKGKKRVLNSSDDSIVKREVKDEFRNWNRQDTRSSLAAQEALIAAQLAAVRAQRARLPNQGTSSSEGRNHKRVKREPGAPHLPTLKKAKGPSEVIDLTLDD